MDCHANHDNPYRNSDRHSDRDYHSDPHAHTKPDADGHEHAFPNLDAHANRNHTASPYRDQHAHTLADIYFDPVSIDHPKRNPHAHSMNPRGQAVTHQRGQTNHIGMNELVSHLKTLSSAPGLSGFEAPVRTLIEAAWRPLADEISTSRLGSLHALRRGAAPQPRPSLLLAAHMDAIGLLAAGLSGEFIRLSRVGGIDPRVLPGQIVTVHGRKELPGVIVRPPNHLLPQEISQGIATLEYLLVDTGLSAGELSRLVRPGDPVSFAQPPFQLSDETLVGHSLDNRASIAALTHCLAALKDRQVGWDLWAVATSQEEVTLGGALTSSFQLRPSLAVAVDVTFASSPGSPAHKTYPLGKGPTLGWGPNIHPALYHAFKNLAERLEIPVTMEAMPHHSGTDAFALQIAAEGAPTMLVSIPLRYMHTPVEMVSCKDVARAGRLLAEFAASLEVGFLETLSWDG